MKIKNLISAILLGFMILAISSCSQNETSDLPEETRGNEAMILNQAQWENGKYELVQIEDRTSKEWLEVNGSLSVAPRDRHILSSHYDAFVEDLRVQNGDAVQKGDILFYMEGPEIVELQGSFYEARALYQSLKLDYDRTKALLKDSIKSAKSFETVKAKYEAASVQYQSLKYVLDHLGVEPSSEGEPKLLSRVAFRAPVSGVVGEIEINSGFPLAAHEPIMVIHNLREPLLDLKVFESDIPKIQMGQKVLFHLANEKGAEYPARIVRLSPNIIPSEGYTHLYAELSTDSLPSHLSYGAYVEGRILYSEERVMSLPLTAVAELDGSYFVLEVEKANGGYSLTPRQVNVGRSNEDFIEILGPSQYFRGHNFINKGVFQLLEE